MSPRILSCGPRWQVWLILRFGFFYSLLAIGAFESLAVFSDQPRVGISPYFGLRAIDSETGQGIPLVRFKTTSNIAYWSDSQGYVAFEEPGLMNTEVYFEVDAPGYEFPADGFGYRGIRVTPQPGKVEEVKLSRRNLAERVRRLTGQGIYRDSELLGLPYPKGTQALNAGVTGSDSVQMVPYRGRLFWLWGDTNLARYPLGNFHVTAATSSLPGENTFPATEEFQLDYLVDTSTGQVKKMLPVTQPGAVWLFGLINLMGKSGEETLVAHYSRHLRLGEMVEHGIATFDDEAKQFQIRATFDLEKSWQVPSGQAIRHRDQTGDFVYFADPFPVVRVPARLDAMLDQRQYEAFRWDQDAQVYTWQRIASPTTQLDEQKLVESGQLPPAAQQFQIHDQSSGRPVFIHRGSVNWNAYRQRWILIGCEKNDSGQPSHLGEVWYAEAAALTGPWTKGIKIVTHPGYSFYNPRQHAAWDQDDGRYIYFEGTYTLMFSSSQTPTPRYEYNQLLYRLDLESVVDPQRLNHGSGL